MDNYVDTILRSNNDIARMNASGYVLTRSVDTDRKMIEMNKQTYDDYIARRDEEPKHSNWLDNVTDKIFGHETATNVDRYVETGVSQIKEGVTDIYNTATSIPTYIKWGAIALVVYLIIKK